MSTHNIFLWRNKKLLAFLSGDIYNKENLFGTGKNWSYGKPSLAKHDMPCLSKHCRWLLKKPIDLDLHCLLLNM